MPRHSFEDIVAAVFSEGVTLGRFEEGDLYAAAQRAWERDEGYVAFRIGLEIGYRAGSRGERGVVLTLP